VKKQVWLKRVMSGAKLFEIWMLHEKLAIQHTGGIT
jgi:hypothetical protein